MSKKAKIRHHELKDAAATETRWIEPINATPIISPVTSKKQKEKNHRKITTMRENKQEHQHQFRHDHERREHDNKTY